MRKRPKSVKETDMEQNTKNERKEAIFCLEQCSLKITPHLDIPAYMLLGHSLSTDNLQFSNYPRPEDL